MEEKETRKALGIAKRGMILDQAID